MGKLKFGRMIDGKDILWKIENWIASCAVEGQDMGEMRRGRNGDARAEQWKDGKWESSAV